MAGKKTTEQNRLKMQRHRARKRAVIDGMFKANGCLLCSERYTPCIDLHHIEPETKTGKLSNYTAPIEELIAEAKGCVPLCKNCHTKVHDGVLEI